MLSLVCRWWSRWRGRQDLARMADQMSALGRYDVMWRDLGLSDLDLKREISKPFWRA